MKEKKMQQRMRGRRKMSGFLEEEGDVAAKKKEKEKEMQRRRQRRRRGVAAANKAKLKWSGCGFCLI